MDMKRRLITCIVAAIIGIALSGLSPGSQLRAQKANVVKQSKTEAMLKAAKANYRQFQGKDSFIVSYNGNEKNDIDVIIVDAGAAVVALVDVAAGREIELTPDVMRKLLEFNMQTDYVKVGISDLGSIRIQTEQDLSLMNAKTFKKILDQTAASADDVAKILAPARRKVGAVN